MAKKKTEEKTVHRPADPNVMGLRGAVVEQPITRTLDENYMPDRKSTRLNSSHSH